MTPASRPEPVSRQSSVHKALVSKFEDRLTVEVAESSKRSDPVATFGDCADKLIEVSCNLSGLLGVTVYCPI